MKKIWHNKPCLDEKEISAVTDVLHKGWLIAGDEVRKFENAFAKYIGSSYAIATNSGTSALHLSLLALGIGTSDEVILPTYTSSDLLNAINYVGATPILIDIEKDSCTINISDIAEKIRKRTKVMIIPHTFGFPADIPALYQYNIPIIEDCAQAIGSVLEDKMVGTFGDISIFSFFATKLLTTGQGGMVVTNNRTYYDYIRDLIDYNGCDIYKTRYNYPLTDIVASIGKVQLDKYPAFSKRRKEIANAYQKVLEAKHIFHLPTRHDEGIVPFRFLFQCQNDEQLQKIKVQFIQKGIEVKQPIASYELLHRLLHQNQNDFLNTEKFSQTMLSLPIYPCLHDDEVTYVVRALENIL